MADRDFYSILSEQMHSFSPGDLVAAMELKEFVDEGKDSQSGSELLLDLGTLFHCYILEGENDELNGQFDQLIARVDELKGESVSKQSDSEGPDDGRKGAVAVRIEDREVLESFLQESHDHLDTIEDRILTLEDSPDADLIDDIFRSMHTIKGVASFIGLNRIKNISHTLESLLDRLRVNELEVNPDLINILLNGTDLLANMISCIERDAESAGDNSKPLVVHEPEVDLSSLLEKIAAIDSGFDPEQNQSIPEELITDEMIRKFIEESSDLLDSAEHSILELENSSDVSGPVGNAFRSIHTVKGNAGFFGFARIEKETMEVETLLDGIRNGGEKADSRGISSILKKLDLIRKSMSGLPDSGGTEEQDKPEEDSYKSIGELLVGMGVSSDEVEKAANLQNKKLGEILVEEGVVSEQTLDQALEAQKRVTAETPAISIKRKDIRIDMEKLDRLFDMVGELITAEAMVVDSEDLKGLELREFNKSALHLTKITREIQSITMSMRMIPLEGLFNKMKRLVRDLSNKMDKPVQFLISGADTEMDRNVIEEIADPLVHIIRNSIDHGLESKNKRVKAGKNPTGIVDLNARYEGNEIWITVRDDGAGLNRKRILEKARSKGLVDAEAEPEDRDVWNLIFEPGFSTVDKVSEISGRGVGMDVVKKNIEKLRGRIVISSEKGKGTTMILRIPLTLAIIESISCRVSHLTLAFQSSDVIEFLKPTADLFTQTGKGRRVINLRSEIIPVIDMNEFYNIKRVRQEEDEGVIVIISSGGVKAALIVDAILGSKQIVVKGLPDLLEKTRAISGCSVLGNGDVCLIVDAAALIKEILE